MIDNLPPMSGRAYRDYFLIEDDERAEEDPYERCDFDDEEDD